MQLLDIGGHGARGQEAIGRADPRTSWSSRRLCILCDCTTYRKLHEPEGWEAKEEEGGTGINCATSTLVVGTYNYSFIDLIC